MTHHATYEFPATEPKDHAINLLRKSGRRIEQVARGPFGSQGLWDIAEALKREAVRIENAPPEQTRAEHGHGPEDE